MPTTLSLSVKDLALDLHNFRTVPQSDEIGSIHALIAIDTDWFWALMESLLDDGYLPTENIIVLKSNGKSVVKEGNRRISALKLAHGYIPAAQFDLPSHIQDGIAGLSAAWKAANKDVPCTVYGASEANAVDRIVSLTHGKGEKAGRAKWKAVARARHNRDKAGASEPALDLLEKYLKDAKNLTPAQRERWAGDYPLSVLEEAMKRLAPRLSLGSARDVADAYPKVPKHKGALDNIGRDIGLEVLGFEQIRNKEKDHFEIDYRIPPAAQSSGASAKTSGQTSTQTKATGAKATKSRAFALDDPKAVLKTLKSFVPRGNNREKVVTLLSETRQLRLDRHPHAFCFLLRSMFEVSAKAYCRDHSKVNGPKATKPNGDDRTLVDVLRDITNHLTKNNTDKQMKKAMHGAITELAKPAGILSVTSMNQLVHNPRFSVKEKDICALFHNIFPLLEEMNR